MYRTRHTFSLNLMRNDVQFLTVFVLLKPCFMLVSSTIGTGFKNVWSESKSQIAVIVIPMWNMLHPQLVVLLFR